MLGFNAIILFYTGFGNSTNIDRQLLTGRIIGGHSAKIEDYPYQVSEGLLNINIREPSHEFNPLILNFSSHFSLEAVVFFKQ